MALLKLTSEIIERETARAVRLLCPWPGVKRIWLFGSAAKGGPWDWRSDLDFAVEGLAAQDQTLSGNSVCSPGCFTQRASEIYE